MQIIDAPRRSPRPRKRCAALTVALTLTGGLVPLVALVAFAPLAHAEAPRYAFAVIANTMQSPADEAPTQRLIEAISRERDVSFIVYDGNLKGAKKRAAMRYTNGATRCWKRRGPPSSSFRASTTGSTAARLRRAASTRSSGSISYARPCSPTPRRWVRTRSH